jgi:predicted permease
MDWRVLVFATALALAAGLLFGLAPALRVTSDLTTAWRRGASGGRRGARLRDGLVVAQVAVSLVLLVAGALCWRSLRRAQSADPGFRVARRVAAQVDLGSLGYTDSAGRLFQRRLVERVAALPGVRHVSTTHALPLATSRTVVGVETGAGAPALEVQEFAVGPDYFRTMDTPLLGGREFAAADDERAPKVAIVNDAAARRLWPNETAVGKRLTIDVAGVKADYAVIGVVATGKYRTLSERPTPVLFLADRQSYRPRVTLIAEVDGTTPAAALAAIRGEVARLDPDLVVQTGTLQEHLAFALFPSRVSGLALSVVGLLGLGLALAGLAAVVAQSVARRTREIGIRMALGATRADVLAEVVRDGARLLAVGVMVGAVVALGVTRVLSGLLYGISATDPATFAAVTALLVATALAACALAGRRALAVDPIEAIRAE